LVDKFYNKNPKCFHSGRELEPELYDEPFSKGPSNQPTKTSLTTEKTGTVDMVDIENQGDLIPQVLATAITIGGSKGKYVFKALLDSGGTGPMINGKCLPRGVQTKQVSEGQFITTAGIFTSREEVDVEHLCLPEFLYTRRFSKIKFHVFDSPHCPYNLILGRQVLRLAKMQFDFENEATHWLGNSVPFHNRKYFRENGKIRDLLRDDPARVTMAEAYMNHEASDNDAVYKIHDPDKVADSQTHLSSKDQCDDLHLVLKNRRDLFTGKIGVYKRRKFCIKLKPDAHLYSN
jgi:hypothetical protein